MSVQRANMARTLGALGLRASGRRLALLEILMDRQPQSMSVEEIYLRLSEAGVGLSTSSVSHALADLERVGLLEKCPGSGRRSLFRCVCSGESWTAMPVFVHVNGDRIPVHDPVLIERLHRTIRGRIQVSEGSALNISVSVVSPALV